MLRWVRLFLCLTFCLFLFSGCFFLIEEDTPYPYLPRHLPGPLDEPLTKGKTWDDEGFDSRTVEGLGWPGSYDSPWE